jgi:tetratricopeptide (TPR) repeat protein
LNFHADISKLIYTIDEEKNRIHIHIFKEMLLIKEIPDVKVYFESALTDCFELKRAFIHRFDELVPNKQGKDLERERAEWIRELFLLREQEFSHQNSEWQWRLNETKRLTLGQVIKTFLDLQEDSLIELKVITEDMKIITNPDAIKEFDLLSPIIASTNPHEASFICQNATLILTCIESHEEKDVSRIVTLSIKSEGETEKSLYARITYTQVPQNINRTIPYGSEKNSVNAHSFLVAWDKFSDNQKIAEFNYLWQEAKEKQETGKFAELTEEQKLICYCVYPHTAYRIYWGKKLFLDKRYYEALLHLENAYFTLQANYHSLHESYKENFYEVCYLIGFCYCELLQFQRAFYFLDIVFNINRIRYAQEYVNCLANSKDFRAIMIIDRLLEQTNIQNKEESEEEINPAFVSFVNFLRRRKAYVYIDLGRLDEAENVFKSMLEEPENSDYALNELAYIQTLRNGKA